MSTTWILTGMTGAGKATAREALERNGIECVDNLPVDLIEGFAALPRHGTAVAVIDARRSETLRHFEGVPGVRVLFLDARDDVLVRRIAESRRPHPLGDKGRGQDAVDTERAVLVPLRAAAELVIDTSDLDPAELQKRVAATIAQVSARAQLACTVSSFGFKFGPQLEADWVFDTRVMRNPFWEPELRALTGLDRAVREFVLKQEEAGHLLQHVDVLITWAAERCIDRDRRYMHVAFGCTGGRHRSVVLAEALAERLRPHDIAVTVRHRDVDRPDPR